MFPLGLVDAHHGHCRHAVLADMQLPHPVTHPFRRIHHRGRKTLQVAGRLADLKLAVRNDGQFFSVYVHQHWGNRHPAIRIAPSLQIHHVKIKPVRIFIIRMPGGVSHINLVFPIATILGIWTCPCGLHHLVRPPIHLHVIQLVRQGKTGNRGMPSQSAPAKIKMSGVVAQDERRRISRVVVSRNTFLLAQHGDIARLAGHAVIKRRLVRVPGIDDEHPLVRQHQERGIVMVVRLKGRTDKHLAALTRQEIDLHGTDVPVHVNVSHV